MRLTEPAGLPVRMEDHMKTIKLYQYGKSTLSGWVSWWSAHVPAVVLGNDFIEHTDTADFLVPEPWSHVYIDGHNGNTLRESAEFATDSGREGFLNTDGNGDPVIVEYSFTGFRSKLWRIHNED